MKYYTNILLVCQCFIASAQSVSTEMGARSAGMANASVVNRDEWSLFNNVGGLGEQKDVSVCFAYEALPDLQGANRMAAGISLPTRIGVAGMGVFRFGDALYSEQIASLGFSNRLGIASLGIKGDYIQYETTGVQTQNAVSISFGGMATLTPTISVGACITNLNQAKITETERLPTKLVAGISLTPATHLTISSEVVKDLLYDATWKTGAEYSVEEKIFFRTGFNMNPTAGFFGLGFNIKKVKCDFAARLNSFPANSFQASAVYILSSRSKK
jgi:hypothetical protein